MRALNTLYFFYKKGKSLFLRMYKTVARKSASARKMRSLSVSSLRLYLVMSFLPSCMVPVIVLNSSLVSWMVLDEVALNRVKINK